MSVASGKKSYGSTNEHDFTELTEWQEDDWKDTYPEVPGFISDFMVEQKRRFVELIPLLQLLVPTPVREYITHLSTDGEHLYYSPVFIDEKLKSPVKKSIKDLLSHQLMHILMHGFLGHFDLYYEDEELAWSIMDLLADRFAKSYFYTDMDSDNSSSLYNPFSIDPAFTMDKNEKKLEVLLDKGMGAYRTIKPMKKSRLFVIGQSEHARSDNHRLWQKKNKDKWKQAIQDIMGGLPSELLQQLQKMNENAARMQNQNQEGEGVPIPRQGSFTDKSPDMKDKDISSLGMIIGAVKSSNKDGFGFGAGASGVSVIAKKDSIMNYSDALRDMVKETERVYEDPASIDPMYYQYGLDMYGDMPIIEPLEENPYPSIENIVFAIDTSGSCGGAVAQRFINETCKVLSDAAALGHVGSITMLQCDTEIQKVQEFDSGKEMMKYLDKTVELGGFGGTSFVPVFDWIEENRTRKGKETTALIYLTDGMGIYPEKKPDYLTYFVLPQEPDIFGGQINVKSWIHKLLLKSDGR